MSDRPSVTELLDNAKRFQRLRRGDRISVYWTVDVEGDDEWGAAAAGYDLRDAAPGFTWKNPRNVDGYFRALAILEDDMSLADFVDALPYTFSDTRAKPGIYSGDEERPTVTKTYTLFAVDA